MGLLSLGLGIVGAWIPVLPTTPFLLLSAALFARSSQKLHRWLLTHPVFGEYIRGFIEDKSIPLKIKIISVSTLWTVMLLTIFVFANEKLWLQLLLFVIAVGVSIHILSYETRKA